MNLHSHPYESYRTSKSEWIDRTPSEWEEKRVKDLFRLVTDKAADDNDHELLSLYASIGVRPRKDLEARGNKASSTDGYWLVKKGDIVVNKLLAWMGSVGLSEYDGVTSPAYDVLRKTSKLVDERYFSYLFRTEIAKQIFKRNSRGIMDMRLRLYFEKLGAITVPVPPFATQQAIATYIDTKTGKIDRQVDLLGQKAKKYVELKQSLICETVTRGLDKSVPMKNSGVEWIGDVPEHWEIKRLKDFIRYTIGGEVIDVSYWNLGTELTYTAGRYPVNSNFNNFPSRKRTKENDILIARNGDGFIHVPIQNSIFTNVVQLVRLCKQVDVRFVYYALENIKLNVNRTSNGDFIASLNKELWFNQFLIAPKIVEQRAIADFLDKKTAQIDRIVTAINTQIDKLKDLRKALINDVVTGKIKVVIEDLAA